jgi:hypothetical protein
MGKSACPFFWSQGASCTDARSQWGEKVPFSWSRLDQELNQNGRPVILGMHRKGYPLDTHWVVVISGHGNDPDNYYMHDPWFLSGREMKLITRAPDYYFDELAIYDGQSPCPAASETTASLEISRVPVRSISVDSVLTGAVLIHSMTEVTMTVQLIAQSSEGNVSDALVWTDTVSNTVWQPFRSLVELPVSDQVYARFRDEFGSTSGISSDTIHPIHSPGYGAL